MSYRINVARLRLMRDGTPVMNSFTGKPIGDHLFATRPEDNKARAAETLREIMRAFPATMFDVTITRWEERGRELDAVMFAEGGEG